MNVWVLEHCVRDTRILIQIYRTKASAIKARDAYLKSLGEVTIETMDSLEITEHKVEE